MFEMGRFDDGYVEVGGEEMFVLVEVRRGDKGDEVGG